MTDLVDVPKIDWIRDRVKNSHYQISEHALRFLMLGKVSVKEIEDAILNGKIIEIHRHPQRGNSSLVLGYSGKKPVHVMCADGKDDSLEVLFAYVPSSPIWDDPKNRSQSGGKPMEEKSRRCFFCGGEIKGITVGNFDYRLEGKLYVIKKVPAELCVQCGEKYISAEAAKRINELIDAGKTVKAEEVQVYEY